MVHIIKSRKIIFMALAIGFSSISSSANSFFRGLDFLSRIPISYLRSFLSPSVDTIAGIGVVSAVGFTTFGAPVFLAPLIVANLKGVAWCSALAYVVFRYSSVDRKLHAIHGDTQQLKQDTNAIKKDTSNIRGTVTKLSDDFATHQNLVKTEFDNMRKQQQQNHAASMQATKLVEKKLTEGLGEVKSEFSGVKAGVAQLDRNVVIMSGDLTNVNKALGEQKKVTHTMHQQTQQEIAVLKTNMQTTDNKVTGVQADTTILKKITEENSKTLHQLDKRTKNIENIVGDVNHKLDHNFEEQQVLSDRMVALKLEAKQILEMHEKSNKTQEQQSSAITDMQSDLSSIKGDIGYMVHAKREKVRKQVATVAAGVVGTAIQLSQRPVLVDGQTNSGSLESEDDLD